MPIVEVRRYGLLVPLPWRSPHTTGWCGRIELQAFCGLTLGKLRCNSLGVSDWWFRELVRHTQSQPMSERPWVIASARRHATCVDAGHIAGVKLAKHVRPLQFVRLATWPNSCVSLARRVTSWFTPRLHRSHHSNVNVESFLKRNSILFPHVVSFCVFLGLFIFKQQNTKHQHSHCTQHTTRVESSTRTNF